MKLMKIQYKKLEKLMPIAGKQAKTSNYKCISAMLYKIENGCKWRVLPHVTSKKNFKFPWLYDTQPYKQRNIIERYFLQLKGFRKVFSCYDKLDFVFISTISLSFIFDLLFI